MFNLSSKKRNLPKEEQNIEDLFLEKSKNPQSVNEDALHLAFTMVRNDVDDPNDALSLQGKVDYWNYLKQYQKKYLEEVFDKAKKLAIQFATQFVQHPEKFPLPKKQEGGGGGGPPMAATMNKKIILAAIAKEEESTGYLIRNDESTRSWYWKGSWGALFVSGDMPLVLKDTSINFIATNNPVVRVSKNSNTINVFNEMERSLEEQLSLAIWENISDFNTKYKRMSARNFIKRCKNTMSWDFNLLVPCVSDFAMSYISSFNRNAHLDKNECMYVEHQAITKAREAVGQILQKYTDKLILALRSDNVKFSLELSSNPPFNTIENKIKNKMEKEKEEDNAIEKMEKSTAQLFYSEKQMLENKLDIKSLILTLLSDKSKYTIRRIAASSIIDLLVNNYRVFAHRPLTKEEADRIPMDDIFPIERSEYTSFYKYFKELIEAASADDARFLEIYTETKWNFPKQNLAKLAAAQGRNDLIKAFPQIGLIKQDGPTTAKQIVPEIINNLDPKNKPELDVLIEAAHTTDFFPTEKLFLVAHETMNPSILEGLKKTNKYFYDILILEKGTNEQKQEVIKDMPMTSDIYVSCAIAKNMPDKIHEKVNISPSWLGIYDENIMLNYMMAKRVDENNVPIPRASEIFSVPKNAINLAKALVGIGDWSAILALLEACAKSYKDGDKDKSWVIAFILGKITGEVKSKAEEILRHFLVYEVDGELIKLYNVGHISTGKIDSSHILPAIKVGNIELAVELFDVVFSYDRHKAVDILNKMYGCENFDKFISMLPFDVKQHINFEDDTIADPQEHTKKNIEATVLSNGYILARNDFSYILKDGKKTFVFASAPEDSTIIASGLSCFSKES